MAARRALSRAGTWAAARRPMERAPSTPARPGRQSGARAAGLASRRLSAPRRARRAAAACRRAASPGRLASGAGDSGREEKERRSRLGAAQEDEQREAATTTRRTASWRSGQGMESMVQSTLGLPAAAERAQLAAQACHCVASAAENDSTVPRTRPASPRADPAERRQDAASCASSPCAKWPSSAGPAAKAFAGRLVFSKVHGVARACASQRAQRGGMCSRGTAWRSRRLSSLCPQPPARVRARRAAGPPELAATWQRASCRRWWPPSMTSRTASGRQIGPPVPPTKPAIPWPMPSIRGTGHGLAASRRRPSRSGTRRCCHLAARNAMAPQWTVERAAMERAHDRHHAAAP